ncbi:FAD-dependent thymidylate synthase [Patescibacteria group bacterium]|nr:FAD-dependent thymidylate synthase [Patescibacteria group bacterium]
MIEKDVGQPIQDERLSSIMYIPEEFSDEKRVELDGLSESDCLLPFFSNLDRPVFLLKNMPEEVSGAISSRYSRATKSLRKTFFDEYLSEILMPEKNKNWEGLSDERKHELIDYKRRFIDHIRYLSNLENATTVNIEKGREFFKKWLAEYGDDSIAEQAAVHLCIEGASNIVINAIETQRINSYIEKSSRYVPFDKIGIDGRYQYAIPLEIQESSMREEYVNAMDSLIGHYSRILLSYLEYIKSKYPKGDDEDDRAFERSRSAKRFDDLRELLPFGIQTSVAIQGNARAMEHLVQRLKLHPISEVREYGEMIGQELESAMPSLFSHINTDRGRRLQQYKREITTFSRDCEEDTLEDNIGIENSQSASLISYDHDGENKVIAGLLFDNNTRSLPYSYYLEKVKVMSDDKKREILDRVFSKRGASREKDRHLTVPKAFEHSMYLFEMVSRGGDFRDLLRHRMTTIERPLFSMDNGFGVDNDLIDSEFMEDIKSLFDRVGSVYQKLKSVDPFIAQYIVPFGFYQRWTMQLSARELYWIAELRTGPQGKPSYRKLVQEIVEEVGKVHPLVFSGVLVDNNDYSLSRRESEIKISNKLKSMDNP